MTRGRTTLPDFWTWEAAIDCAPMTRRLFIGLCNFADDGSQPLRPHTIVASAVLGVGEPGEQPLPSMANHSKGDTPPFDDTGEQPSPTMANHSNGDPRPFGGAGERPSHAIANHSNGDTPPFDDTGEQTSPTMANHSNDDPRPFGEAGERPSRTIANL